MNTDLTFKEFENWINSNVEVFSHECEEDFTFRTILTFEDGSDLNVVSMKAKDQLVQRIVEDAGFRGIHLKAFTNEVDAKKRRFELEDGVTRTDIFLANLEFAHQYRRDDSNE